MVSVVQSNVAVAAALLASLATSEAAYGNLFVRSRPSTSLGYRMVPATRNRSLFTRDIDAMFDTMFEEMEEMLYEPFPLQRMSRPSYLLQGFPALNALVQGGQAQESKPVAKNSYGITQDDTQLQIVLNVPGAKASDVNIALEDGVLTVSGEYGISVHSRFERSITLPRDVDTNEIAARMNDGVLTITAPKVVEQNDTVRRIDIVEDKKAESIEATDKEGETNAALPNEKDEDQEKKPELVDETVIDLDVKKE